MSKLDKFRPAFNLLGFIFGLASGCFAISNATITLLIIASAFSNPTEPYSRVSLQIVGFLCIIVAAQGVLLIQGSIMVWKMRILGAAINLASGIVLTALSAALSTIGGSFLGIYPFVSLVEPLLMSVLSVLSGSLASAALF